MHMHANPVVTSYPTDDACCVEECADGTCQDPVADKVQSHLNLLSWAQGQAAAQNCPPCPPCPPCSVAEFKKFHAAQSAQKAGAQAIPPAVLQAIIAFIMQAIQAFLPILFPPTPAPAKKP